MTNLFHEPWFTFRFEDDRIIPRFHLEGVPSGTPISVIKIDPATGEPREFLQTASVGLDGWVDLVKPIIVKAGEAFRAMPIIIRSETDRDHDIIRHVNRLAFGQDAEARLVDALRAGGYSRVSLIAEWEGHVVGHILFSDLPIITSAGTIGALALAPMAVLPDYQCKGIGSAMVRRGLEVCGQAGHRIVVVLGHPEFYPRFGFSAKFAEHLESPFSSHPAFMAVELVPGALDGVQGRVVYSPPFEDVA